MKTLFRLLPHPLQDFMRTLRNGYRGAMRQRQMQKEITSQLIAGLLPKDPVIIEAGAHVGTETLWMSRAWPRGVIHAFEPIPTLYSDLQRNTVHRKNVQCYPLALGDMIGVTKMYVSSGESDGSSSVLRPKEHLTHHPEVLFNDEITVHITTIDEWAHQYGVPRVDFLWLDLQGYELNALKAATTVLSSVKAIHTEFRVVEDYQSACQYSELREWLGSQGFHVIHEEVLGADGGNVLFAR